MYLKVTQAVTQECEYVGTLSRDLFLVIVPFACPCFCFAWHTCILKKPQPTALPGKFMTPCVSLPVAFTFVTELEMGME